MIRHRPSFKVTALIGIVLGAVLALRPRPSAAYAYCGAHDGRHEMRAYYLNSDFWVGLLEKEAAKWNAVHSVLHINAEKTSSFPASPTDGQNVISWVSDAELQRLYNRPWGVALGITFTRIQNNCGTILETDLLFNPGAALSFT